MQNVILKKAYLEVEEFLELLGDEYRNKIPKNFLEFIKSEKDTEYQKKIYLDIPIEEQNLMKETLQIIAFLNLRYWCNDEKEKQRLKEVYRKNAEKFEEEKREKYNPYELFRKREKSLIKSENMDLVVKKDNIIQKIIKKILNIFWNKK